jgi:serine/threonine protein kinase
LASIELVNNVSWFLNSADQVFYIVELGFDWQISLSACMVTDLVIISYPFVTGGNTSSKCSDFAGIISQLAFSHRQSFVQGDIRMSNMIFTPDGRSTLIDFDFSGRQGLDKYPEGLFDMSMLKVVKFCEVNTICFLWQR